MTCATEVEAAGWDGVWLSDHPFPKVAAGAHGHHSWDPFAALAFVAAATGRLTLQINLVVLPYRNPFVAASSAATVQHLSGGRLAMGIGSGYHRPEFEALGVDYERREQLVREGVGAMRAAWSGAPVHATGSGWRADGNTLVPAAPPARLVRGGNSRAAIVHAAHEFDVWGPFEAVGRSAAETATASLTHSSGLAERIELLRDEAAAAGREAPEVWLTRRVDDWLDGPAESAREQIAALEEIGVSQVAVAIGSLEDASLDSYRRRVAHLAELVRY